MEDRYLYKITIRGRVQGVGFRRNAVIEARIRGIEGFVMNMSDGGVYIEAEGTAAVLDDYLKWCRRGPLLSNVRSVDTKKGAPEGHKDFKAIN